METFDENFINSKSSILWAFVLKNWVAYLTLVQFSGMTSIEGLPPTL